MEGIEEIQTLKALTPIFGEVAKLRRPKGMKVRLWRKALIPLKAELQPQGKSKGGTAGR